MRERVRRGAVLGAMVGASMLIAGCGRGVEIARVPLISPVVLPAPDVFKANVAVKNYGTTPSPNLWLRVNSEYWPTGNQAQPPCKQLEDLPIGVLAAGQSWAKADYQIDRNSGCACVKNACPGHVTLSLHVAPGYGPTLGGPNTLLHVNWAADGDLSKMTISPPP